MLLQINFMDKIIGLGGLFIKANDPKSLGDWYQQYPGISFHGNNQVDLPFTDSYGKLPAGYNVLSFFPNHSPYFDPSEKKVVINLRVGNLFGLLVELKSKGVALIGEPVDE